MKGDGKEVKDSVRKMLWWEEFELIFEENKPGENHWLRDWSKEICTLVLIDVASGWLQPPYLNLFAAPGDSSESATSFR